MEKRRGQKRARRCVLKEGVSVFVSAEAFDIFSQGEDLESCGGFSWCEPFGEA